jgi:sulfite exporter TauE/SafE
MIWAALIMGLLGSLHCVGMCGPLMLALPEQTARPSGFISSQLIYHSGRITTYMILGVIAATFASTFRIAGLQQWASIISGVILLLLSIHLILPANIRMNIPLNGHYITQLKTNISIYLKKTGLLNRYLLGSLNGLLPCGLVYIALASANIHRTFSESILFMAWFGLGTLPALFIVSLTKRLSLFKSISVLYRWYPYAIVFMSLLLILRGMNLGIPYISPEIDAVTCKVNCCHH